LVFGLPVLREDSCSPLLFYPFALYPVFFSLSLYARSARNFFFKFEVVL
jgi:hypothetical protein